MRTDRNTEDDTFIYIDDVRAMGSFDWECCNLIHKFLAKFNCIGIKNNTRKKKRTYQKKGPWVGLVVNTEDRIKEMLLQ